MGSYILMHVSKLGFRAHESCVRLRVILSLVGRTILVRLFSGPAVRHTLSRLNAIVLRTRKTGSSARFTTSGMTNCWHKSGPKVTAKLFSKMACAGSAHGWRFIQPATNSSDSQVLLVIIMC